MQFVFFFCFRFAYNKVAHTCIYVLIHSIITVIVHAWIIELNCIMSNKNNS